MNIAFFYFIYQLVLNKFIKVGVGFSYTNTSSDLKDHISDTITGN